MVSSCLQSLVPSSSSLSLFFPSNTKNAEKNNKNNTISMDYLRNENPNASNFCKRRAVLFVGISALPFLQLRARGVENLVEGERDIRTPDKSQNAEKVLQGEAPPDPFLSLLSVVGVFSLGVLGALYALARKENTATEATMMKTKLSDKEAAMALLEKNFEKKLLNEQEERTKQIRKEKEGHQSLLNQLTLANSTITGLGKQLQSEKRLVKDFKSHIDRLQTGITKVEEEKKMLEEKLKEKLDSIEVLQERINFLSIEIADKENSVQNLTFSLAEKASECKNLNSIYKQANTELAEANSEIKQLKKEVLDTQKEIDSKNSAVDDMNARVSLLVAERDDTNRRVDAIQEDFNDLKLSSEKKAATDAELLAKREHELHQIKEKLGLALNEANGNQALIADLTEKRDNLSRMLEIEMNNRRNLKHELQITQETLGASRVEASDMSKQLKQSTELCKDLEAEVSRVQNEITKDRESFKRSLDEVKSNSDILASELTSVKEVLKKTDDELQVVSDELAAARETCESLKKELLDIYKKAESSAHDLKEEKKMVASLNKELHDLEKQILKDKEARNSIETDLEETTQSLNEMNRNVLMLSRDFEMANTRINSLKNEKDMLYNSLIEQKNVSHEAREDMEDAHNLVMRLGKERESLEKRAKKLEEELASAKGEILQLRSRINSSSLVNDQLQQKSEVVAAAAVKKSGRRRKSGPQ